jgi:acyl carrier protein
MNTVNEQQIRAFVRDYISKKFQGNGEAQIELDDSCDLLMSGVVDSMGLLELTAAISTYCGQDIDFESLDPEEMTIVGPLCRFVAQQIAKRNESIA